MCGCGLSWKINIGSHRKWGQTEVGEHTHNNTSLMPLLLFGPDGRHMHSSESEDFASWVPCDLNKPHVFSRWEVSHSSHDLCHSVEPFFGRCNISAVQIAFKLENCASPPANIQSGPLYWGWIGHFLSYRSLECDITRISHANWSTLITSQPYHAVFSVAVCSETNFKVLYYCIWVYVTL